MLICISDFGLWLVKWMSRWGDIILDEILRLNKLYDYYGNLLSDNQKNCFQLYYLFDYSLNEIASELNISKQGVSDNIKRASRNLENYEDNLKLVERFEKTYGHIHSMKEKLNLLIEQNDSQEIDGKLKELLDYADIILEDQEV